MRVRLAGILAVVVVGVCAALAVAQQPPPTVTINMGPGAVSVAATEPVPAGPTRFNAVRSGDGEMSVYVMLLVPGVTLDQFRAALEEGDRTRSAAPFGLVSIQASWGVGGRDDAHAATFTVKPGLTYVVMSEAFTGEEEPPQRALTTFQSSGTPNGAAAPTADATVRMAGLRFRGDRVLPRNGVVRFDNRDASNHFGIAFPLRPGVKAKRVGKALRSNAEKAFGRIVAGPPTELQGIISGGDTTNYQEVRLGRKGRYALICFFDEHHRLGMYRVVSVK